MPNAEACLNCRSTCPRGATCPQWFLSGVIKRIERARQEHASFRESKSGLTGD
jgi:hypothetical protein